MLGTPPTRVIFAALSLALASAPSSASDYSNLCRSADGVYEIDDGELRRADAAGTQAPAIPYAKVRETVHYREVGHCLSRAARGQKFKYEARTSTLSASFTDGGTKRELDFACEFVADGLPAAYECDERVVTEKIGKEPVPETAADAKPDGERGRTWLHNGSVMRLEKSGDERRFFYQKPRAGIAKVGAAPGTLLFEGRQDGQSWSGTAYVFSADCPPQPFAVTGRLTDGGRRLVMTGKSPRIGPSCNATATRDDTLVFTWQP